MRSVLVGNYVVWLCDALEAQLRATEGERARHSAFEPRGVRAGEGGIMTPFPSFPLNGEGE